MPPNAPGPVQVRKPVAVADTVNGHSVGRNGVHPNACRQVGGRRIFVQTYAGNVLGIELDRADKVESVKKKVQAAFNIPTEQSTLVFGDHVLDKDLSAISSDAPVLLRKGIYRSSSTPCLSPSSRDVRQSSVFEIVGGLKHSKKIQRLVREAAKGSEAGVQPVLASGGLGGAYYFRNCFGENVAIVKPTDEEPFAPNNPKGFTGRALGQPGLKPSIRVGETGLREVAAYLLDHDNFAKVPVTALVNATHSIFNVNAEYVGAGHSQPGSAKIASFQQFVRHDFAADEYGTSRFPVSSVHRIGILDVRLFNTDRHAGNILVKKTNVETESLFGEEMDLIPIDHGLCLPETLDEPYFEWLHWPQASIPFSEEELDYIEKLDPIKDCNLLRKELPTLREACLRMLVLSTTFLKLAAEAGLTLSEIGGMMTRELCGVDEEASELEIVCVRAKMGVCDGSSSSPDSDGYDEFSFAEDCSDDFQFDMDVHDEVPALKLPDMHERPSSYSPANGYRSMSPVPTSPSWSPYFGESSPQMGLSSFRTLEISPMPRSPLGFPPDYSPTSLSNEDESYSLSRMSMPSRSTSLKLGKYRSHTQIEKPRAMGLRGYAAMKVAQNVYDAEDSKDLMGGPLSLTDMDEKAWALFLERFQSLLCEAFAAVKLKSKNQVQRLGTSCRF
ncbi:phosphatidylinositol 4-kinase gamma 6 [Physcomitrium patens]|uniref:1-phosphatidylinositol 4-kinase n=1 Tax=Physcomitrium patens TaxID=3218 RepID=A0A2K1JYS9_PHYPA|nr:phosphatidylinositol 4-kinase gamma 6-like [Physcomitrium patens]PNR46682.1 hypothetical protein PHYPA_013802 [Physcomitrium patens]|eukprot:XP_024385722.1 phosphatidylinositol 4-kinase gamma 6-like [Physcomitrella patens]